MAEKRDARIHCPVCDNLTAARGPRNERLAGTDITCEQCKASFIAHDTLVVNTAPGAKYAGGRWAR